MTQILSVAPRELPDLQQPCFECLEQDRRASATSYSDLHQCVLRAVACAASTATGGNGDDVAEQGLLDALVAIQQHLSEASGHTGFLHSAVISSTVEVIRAVSSSEHSLAVMANAALALRWVSVLVAETAAGDPDGLADQANTVLALIGNLQVSYQALRQEFQEGPNYLPTEDCGFSETVKAVQESAARALLLTLRPGAAPRALGSAQMRQLLGMLETQYVADDMIFQLTDPTATNDGRSQRHRRLLQADGKQAAPVPEVSLPRTLATACNNAPLVCPQPVVLKLSYISDSNYLFMSLGRGLWAAAAARYARVPVRGLRVDLVSGQLGVELISMPNSSLAMLGSWATLQFPIDQQITGATLAVGKLCARIDYQRMVPVITEQPTIINGTVASCTVDSEGDYVVMQLSYGTVDEGHSGVTYTPLSQRDLPEIYDTGKAPYSKYVFAPSTMARFEVAVAVMVLLTFILVAVMILRCVKTLNEDPFADETQPGRQVGRRPSQGMSKLRRQLSSSSTRFLIPTSSRKYISIAYDEAQDEASGGHPQATDPERLTDSDDESSTAGAKTRSLSLRGILLLLSAPAKQMDNIRWLTSSMRRSPSTTGGMPDILGPAQCTSAVHDSPVDHQSSGPAPFNASKRMTWPARRGAAQVSHMTTAISDDRETVSSSSSRTWRALLSTAAQPEDARTGKSITQRLLDMDARGDRDEQGNTALHIAAGLGSLEAVQSLLQAPDSFADVRHLDYRGRTPVHTAARAGHDEVLRVLLHRGVSQSRARSTATTKHGSTSDSGDSEQAFFAPRSARHLFCVNKRDCNGLTILHHAALERPCRRHCCHPGGGR